MLERASFRYTIVLYILDILVTLGSLFAALLARRAWELGKPFVEQNGGASPPVFVIVAVVWSAAFLATGAYDPRRILRFEREMSRVLVAIGVASLLFAGALYFSYRGVSRLLVVYFIVFDTAGILLLRIAARMIWHNLGARRMPTSRTLIIGAGTLGQEIARSFLRHSWMGLETIGFLDDDPAKRGAQIEGLPVLGALSDTPTIVAEHKITDVVIALPMRAHREMADLVAQIERLPVNIKAAPDLGPLVFYKMTVESFGDIPLIGLKEPVLKPHQRIVKRGLDIVISFFALLVSWPICAAIAIAIKADSPGPAIFRQPRAGENGKPFTMYKFRSMVLGAEKLERDLVEKAINHNQSFKLPNDERVTRVGRFLRRKSLDELPQFWNVLKGDMSLVGPRPELPVLVEHYEPWQRKRFGVPQGMTGWWQIHDRSDKPMYWHTEDDLYYLRNYSLLLDLRIIALTAWAAIRGKGAY